MLDLAFWVLILIISLVVLVKSASSFIGASEKIGLYLGMPPFIVGITIVAMGTSLPELVSSLFSVFIGSSEIVAGTAIGSNISNIFLILGITAIVGRKLKVAHELIEVDLPIFVASALLLAVTAWDGRFTFFEGLLSLAALVIYIRYTIVSTKKNVTDIKGELSSELRGKKITRSTWLVFAVSMLFIYLGGKYTVESVINIASIAHVSSELIALTAIALGTSLPELAVTIAAVRKNNAAIAIGNILGSNVFNSLAVMGIPALFGTLIISPTILSFALPFMLVATLLCFIVTLDNKINSWEGWFFVIFYIFFISKILGFV